VLTGVFVRLLIKPPNQLLEDRPHFMVIYTVGVEIGRAELLNELKQKPFSSMMSM
jgi:hypothetical protein